MTKLNTQHAPAPADTEPDEIILPCPICQKPWPQSRAFLFFAKDGVACEECHAKNRAGFGWNKNAKEWYVLPEKERAPLPVEERNWHATCPAAYKLTDENRLPALALERVKEWKYGPKGLILVGPTGSCKTRCLFQLLKRIILVDRLTTKVFFSEQWASFVAVNCIGDESAMDARKELLACDVLVFDDLFAERYTERAESMLLGIIDARLRDMKPILITAMYTGEGLVKAGKFLDAPRGAAVLRRLREACDAISFKPTTAK